LTSLSRPGGNVTGIFVRQLELASKRIEIAREAFPRATVVGIAFDTVSREQSDAAAEAARKLSLEPRMIEVKGEQDYGGAFSAMDDARGQPLILPASPIFMRDRAAIAQALLERRIPSVAAFRENMEAGALISYGFDLMGLFYDIASYVHRIAGGRQAVRHTDRAIAALLHGGQSQDGGIARRFFVGCVRRPGQRGARMRRREFITLLGGAAASWSLAARAQQPGKLPTIGYLGQSTLAVESQRVAALVQRLRELGWTEGRTVAIEYRWGEGRSERAAEIAVEFVRLKVDVIVTSGTPQVIAARQATSLIPIVFASAGDPVGSGLVASLARPGGNVTGLSSQMTDTAAKRLEFLREVVPSLRRLAIMVNVSNPLAVLEMVEAQAAVRTLGLDAVALEIRQADDIASAFEALKGRADRSADGFR
jgi:ABC-type uncharacterized transport system substrate-binding protein